MSNTQDTTSHPDGKASAANGKKPHHRIENAAKYARSNVTNGTRLLHSPVNENSAWVRRCKDLINLHIADLGGEANVSAAEHALVRRAAVLITELEKLEIKFATREDGASVHDLDRYARGASTLRRLFQVIGLKRRSRDVGPSLGDLMRQPTIESDDGRSA